MRDEPAYPDRPVVERLAMSDDAEGDPSTPLNEAERI